MQINQRIAENLAKTVPGRYLPSYIKVKENKVKLTEKANLWEAFNELTERIWHTEKIQPRSQVCYLQNVHRAIVKGAQA